MPTIAGLTSAYGPGTGGDGTQDVGERGERGYRRRRLAAMAGSLYRSGQQAVTEIRESYAQTRARGLDDDPMGLNSSPHIPDAFPDVVITSQGDEQMVLFPSYAKRHTRRAWSNASQTDLSQAPQASVVRDEEYWRQEWERHEDSKAIVDVDVRGWIYSPHIGPMTRRNRILIGLARQLSGISAPNRTDQGYGSAAAGATAEQQQQQSQHRMEDMRDREKIAREAALIERRGREEKRVAYGGGYSERQGPDTASFGLDAGTSSYGQAPYRRESLTPDPSRPASPMPAARQASSVNELSEADLALANANLMARIAPFLTNPHVALPITIFFYDDTQSQSRTVLTNDAGHFVIRAQLEFVPTGVRVLANERLSATQDVTIIEPLGVSLISDVDDTVKHSNISAGAREIFRNTFVRELGDLTVDGVREWYNEMDDLGVSIHYCSNSPWQLFPVLASFFKLGGLPPGSLHLKQYSGMLQGIFEPVAERKKTTLNHLMRDFPERKFILVGDSGEADLEVYTELALANPGRILAVFIRDVTTPPERKEFFDSAALDLAAQRKMSCLSLDGGRSTDESGQDRPHPTGAVAAGRDDNRNGMAQRKAPATGTLIDISHEPEEVEIDRSAALEQVKASRSGMSAVDLLSERKPPPPRPAKPAALRSKTSTTAASTRPVDSRTEGVVPGAEKRTTTPPPPPPPRKAASSANGGQLWPPQQAARKTGSEGADDASTQKAATTARRPATAGPPPPPPSRRVAASSSSRNLSPRPPAWRRDPSSNADVDFEPLPPASVGLAPSFGLNYFGSGSRSGSRSGRGSPTGSPVLGAQVVNKKLELWLRRLERAHEQLDQQGVALYTWRRGQDVMVEAAAIVKEALEEMERGATERRKR